MKIILSLFKLKITLIVTYEEMLILNYCFQKSASHSLFKYVRRDMNKWIIGYLASI